MEGCRIPKAQSITLGANALTLQNRLNRAYSISAEFAEVSGCVLDFAETDMRSAACGQK